MEDGLDRDDSLGSRGTSKAVERHVEDVLFAKCATPL